MMCECVACVSLTEASILFILLPAIQSAAYSKSYFMNEIWTPSALGLFPSLHSLALSRSLSLPRSLSLFLFLFLFFSLFLFLVRQQTHCIVCTNSHTTHNKINLQSTNDYLVYYAYLYIAYNRMQRQLDIICMSMKNVLTMTTYACE